MQHQVPCDKTVTGWIPLWNHTGTESARGINSILELNASLGLLHRWEDQWWPSMRPVGLDFFNQNLLVTTQTCHRPSTPGAMACSLWKLHTFCWFIITLAQVHSTQGKSICLGFSKNVQICSYTSVFCSIFWMSIVSGSMAASARKIFFPIVLFRDITWAMIQWLEPKLLLWVQAVLV